MAAGCLRRMEVAETNEVQIQGLGVAAMRRIIP